MIGQVQRKKCIADQFINDFSKRRQPSALRELSKMGFQRKDLIKAAGELPNPAAFPITEVNFKIQGRTPRCTAVPTYKGEMQQASHHPQSWDDYDIIVTPGGQDGLSRVVDMLLEEGDPLLVSTATYIGMHSIISPFNLEIIGIEEDKNGVRADVMREILEKRKRESENGINKKRFPRVMYVVPTGSNPTGVTISTERKREIYEIASEYNIIILEDDPYFHLHFEKEYPLSFLSLDTDSRVIRFDSFSKIIAPGLRVGFMTAAKNFVQHIDLHMQASTLHASSLSQMIVYRILKAWSKEDFADWCRHVQSCYRVRRDAAVRAADKYLTGLAEWNVPAAGMFLWIKINGLKDVHKLVVHHCIKRGVLLTPGDPFLAHESQCQYVRISFSYITFEELDKTISVLAETIKAAKSGGRMILLELSTYPGGVDFYVYTNHSLP